MNFGFVQNTALIISGVLVITLQGLHKAEVSSAFFVLPSWWGSFGYLKEWEETEAGLLTQTGHWIFQTMWYPHQYLKLGQRRRKEGMFLMMVFVSPSHHEAWQGHAVLKTWNICLPMASSKWILWVFLLVWFWIPHHTVSISTHEFYSFYPSDSFPCWWQRERVALCDDLVPDGVKQQHIHVLVLRN